MFIKVLMMLSVLTISSCGLVNRVPSEQNDACSLLQYKASWKRALNKVHKKYGVLPSTQLAFIKTESNFRPRAKPPRKFFLGIIPAGRISSAYGYSQALDGTWDWYKRDTGNRSARRSSFADSADFIGWYINQTNRKLKISKSNVYDQYLAYHQGHVGYKSGRYKSSEALKGVAKRTSNTAKAFRSQLKKCRL